jgi:hypothetical protein
VDENWEELLGFLPADYEELANVHRQLQVQYGVDPVRWTPPLREMGVER